MIAYPLETTLGKSILDQIESEALNGEVVKALRLCKTLGGKSSSAEIREWASLELRGETPPVVARLSQNCWLSNTSENHPVEVFNYGSEAFFR